MCENGLFQHRFLHNKFLNDESLQIHEHWHVVEKIAADCDDVS